CMDSNPKKRPSIRYVNALITFWIEEIENSDDETNNFRSHKVKPNIEPLKYPDNIYI
ncbi:12110_t:CDS:1, partial [Racocetra persica]